jgi:hypothetical protein
MVSARLVTFYPEAFPPLDTVEGMREYNMSFQKIRFATITILDISLLIAAPVLIHLLSQLP